MAYTLAREEKHISAHLLVVQGGAGLPQSREAQQKAAPWAQHRHHTAPTACLLPKAASPVSPSESLGE